MSIVIIGASHAGVTLAFALRNNSLDQPIYLISEDLELPYHRPPLSKSFLTEEKDMEAYALKSLESYAKENIQLILGKRAEKIVVKSQKVILNTGEEIAYDKLVLATGARPLVPTIQGVEDGISFAKIHVLRSFADVIAIKNSLLFKELPIAIIGAGYIGLELAATFTKLGHKVLVFEKESRILSRTASEHTSAYFHDLHLKNGVEVFCNSAVCKFENKLQGIMVHTSDLATFHCSFAVLGVGITVNDELALAAGVIANNGIQVNAYLETSVKNIYAIGDCAQYFSKNYNRNMHLESVQNATDQARTLAKNLTGVPMEYDCIPWFWSDQYHVKFQSVGLSNDFDFYIHRVEQEDSSKESVWYFKGDKLVAVDAFNHGKAYAVGTKLIQNNSLINLKVLRDNLKELNFKDLVSNSE